MLSLLEQKASPFHREGTGTVGGDKLEDDDEEQEDAEDMTENHRCESHEERSDDVRT